MSVTPGLGAFNKDKVANKFGIQLKNKNTNPQIQQSLSPTTEKKILDTQISSVSKNQTVSDFRSQNQSTNGIQSNINTSKSPQMIRKMLENSSSDTKSSTEHLSSSTNDQRRNSSNSNINHSISSQLLSQSLNTSKRSSLTSTDRSKSPSPSLTDRRMSITKTFEKAPSPVPTSKQSTIRKTPEPSLSSDLTSKRPSIPITTTKTEAEIEHQKDQPLYKRQLSKTLDNATSMANKNKHPYELSNTR